MTQFARQTIDKKQVKLWKIIGIIFVTVALMNYSLKLSEGLGPVFFFFDCSRCYCYRNNDLCTYYI